MDEYLDEEVEAAKLAFDGIGKEWDRQVRHRGRSLCPLLDRSRRS